MKTFLKLIITFLGFISTCSGSGYGEIHFDSMKISSKFHKLDIGLDNMHNDVKVEVKIDGKIIPIDPKFLWGAKNIERSSVKVKVGPMNPNAPEVLNLNEVGFYLTFEFGDTYDHGSPDKEVIVLKFVRLHFKNGKLEFSELYEPLGEYKNKWKLFDMWPDSQNDSEDLIERISFYE